MASISPSSSPRWDSRNTGFISPSQLHLLKQQEEQQRQYQQQFLQQHQFPEQIEPPTPARVEAPQPTMFRTTSRQDTAPMPATAPTHSRTTSAFSLFKSKVSHNHTSSNASLAQSTGEHGELRNGNGHQSTPSTSSKGPMSPSLPLTPGSEQPQAPAQPANNPGPGAPSRAATIGSPSAGAQPQLHPEIRSVVQLNIAHTQKVYFSGPLIRRIERQPDGQRPTKDEGWRDVWAQLGGTTLSVWDMKEIEDASKQGRQVPPSYVNITDAVSIYVFVSGTAVETRFPSSWCLQVHSSAGISHHSRHTHCPGQEVYERVDFEQRRF